MDETWSVDIFFRRFLTRHGIGNHAFRSTYKNKVGWKFVFSRN